MSSDRQNTQLLSESYLPTRYLDSSRPVVETTYLAPQPELVRRVSYRDGQRIEESWLRERPLQAQASQTSTRVSYRYPRRYSTRVYSELPATTYWRVEPEVRKSVKRTQTDTYQDGQLVQTNVREEEVPEQTESRVLVSALPPQRQYVTRSRVVPVERRVSVRRTAWPSWYRAAPSRYYRTYWA